MKTQTLSALVADAGQVEPLFNLFDAIEIAAKVFSVSVDAISDGSRTQPAAFARQLVMTSAFESGDFSKSEIGNMFGKDHGTVCHAISLVYSEAKNGSPRRRAKIKHYLELIEKRNAEKTNGSENLHRQE